MSFLSFFLSFFLAFSEQTYFPHTPPATPPQIKTLKKKSFGLMSRYPLSPHNSPVVLGGVNLDEKCSEKRKNLVGLSYYVGLFHLEYLENIT